MKSFNEFLNEAVSVGDWVKQELYGNDVYYGYVYKVLKNGAGQAIVIEDRGGSITGQAASKSLRDWHPKPFNIEPSEVPAKAIQKIKAKASKLGVDVG